MAHLVISAKGVARFGARSATVALGRGGVGTKQAEGDGVTPIGAYQPLRVLWRPDRLAQPRTYVPTSALRPGDIWIDDLAFPRLYNQFAIKPHDAGHELLWRHDSLYDVIVIINYNLPKIIHGAGSAIFLHCASEIYAPTEGCVAFARNDLIELLVDLSPTDYITILNH